jgi:sugar/nucleoside kinase (ribokinase family)
VLRRERIDVSRVRRDPSVKTGVTVSITRGTHRALVTFPGSIAALDGSTLKPGTFVGFDHVHGSSYFLQPKLQPWLPSLFEQAHRARATTSLDTGFDPSEQWDSGLKSTLAATDVFLPNEIEAAAISETSDPVEAVRRLTTGNTRTVIKLGSEGCVALDGDRAVRGQPFAVIPVDTTGAGDSFNAGFLHAWLRRVPLEEALRFACACGALSTLALGGIGGQPTLEQVHEFMNRPTTSAV